MTYYDPQIHHRRSIRLKGHDYSQPGAYFITLVAFQRDSLFGACRDGKVQLSLLGKIVQDEWMRSNGIRKEITLHEDEFVIMPNHLHGIIWLIGTDGVRPYEFLHPVGADGVRPNEGVRTDDNILLNSGVQQKPGAYHAPLRRKPRSISSFVAGFKAAVASRAGKELDMTKIWQRNYYDHIIRNDQDFLNIWEYIDTNPQRWQEDQLYLSLPSNLSDGE